MPSSTHPLARPRPLAVPVGAGRLLRLAAAVGMVGLATGLLTGNASLRIVAPLFGVLVCVQLYPLLRGGRVDLFEAPTFTGLYAAFGTLATIAAFAVQGSISLNFVEHLSEYDQVALAVRAVACLLIGHLAYYLGYYHPAWGPRAAAWIPSVAVPRWNRFRVHLVAAVLIGAFVVTYAVFQGRLGVPLTDPTQLAAGKAVWRDEPTFSWMIRGTQFGFLACLLYAAAGAARPGWRGLLLPAVFLVANAWLVSRLGQRGSYMFPLLAVIGVVHYLKRRIPVLTFVLFLVAALVVSNVQLKWRQGDEDARPVEELRALVAEPAESLAYHEAERQRFSALALVLDAFPEHVPHLLGQTYAGVVATFIPRWLWTTKNEHFMWRDSAIVWRLVGQPIPTSYLGVLYVNWSYLGIVMGMILWGVFHRATVESRRRHPKDPATVLMYVTALLFFTPTMLGISAAVQFVLPAFVALKFIGGRPRRSLAAEALPRRLGSAPSAT